MNIQKTYSSIEISQLTGIGLRTIQRRAEAGKIGVKIGRDWRFSDEDIQKLSDGKIYKNAE